MLFHRDGLWEDAAAIGHPGRADKGGGVERTVITYGTFDLLHVGHVRLLERAKALGTRLVVGISSDDFNASKGKRGLFPWEERAELVGALGCVDAVFREDSWDQKRTDIEREGASIFAIGDDWAGRFDDLCDLVEVVYLPRTPSVSTTGVKSALKGFSSTQVEALRDAVDVVSSIVDNLR